MTDEVQRKTLLARYLLGEVSTEERDEMEDRYLHDDDLFEELVAAENDMMDDYARGKLTGLEKEKFELNVLSNPERRERIQFARSLMVSGLAPVSVAGNVSAPRATWPASWTLTARWTAAAALLALLTGFGWMTVVNRKLRDELEGARIDRAIAERRLQELLQVGGGQYQANSALPPAGSATLSLALVPDLARGHGRQVILPLAPSISRVLLVLRRQNDESPPYDVVLETAEGARVWQRTNLGSLPADNNAKVITVEMSSNVLRPGDYVLRLLRSSTGKKSEELSDYSFRVVRP
jgi:anti-sigma factor RsiW